MNVVNTIEDYPFNVAAGVAEGELFKIYISFGIWVSLARAPYEV